MLSVIITCNCNVFQEFYDGPWLHICMESPINVGRKCKCKNAHMDFVTSSIGLLLCLSLEVNSSSLSLSLHLSGLCLGLCLCHVFVFVFAFVRSLFLYFSLSFGGRYA